MKPAFALDFRNDAISLLHRTPGGWHQVGRVTFDDPDLPAALGYLRSTALGLSPRGVSTKLILPDDQILFTTLHAPGPDDASRAAQIRAGLDGRTPYPVEDLVFDWEAAGSEVRVAVIARETLAEAEAFAAEHRFNPVSFVAAPANGFGVEPWFGPTNHAASLLADGETVERDEAPVAVEARGGNAAVKEATAPAEPPSDPAPEVDPQIEAAPDAMEDIPAEVAPAPAVMAQDIPAAEPQPQDRTAAVDVDVDVDKSAFGAGFATEPDDLPEDQPTLQDDDLPDLPAPVREQPLFGQADDEPAPSQAIRATPLPIPPRPSEPRVKERRGQDFWGKPGSARTATPEPPPMTAAPPVRPKPADTLEDLPEDRGADLQDDRPADAISSGFGLGAVEAPMALDVEEDEADRSQGSRQPKVTDPALPDDVPPVPGYSPAMGFASRRASADPAAGQAGGSKLAAPPRPTVARPSAARPLAPVAPKAERPMVDRPTAVNPTPQRENKGLRGLGSFVTAPGLPGSRKKKAAGAVDGTPAAATLSPEGQPLNAPAQRQASSIEKGIGAGRTPVRGKPRYLGLMLTAILLIILAVIAAWSTSLAFRSDDSADTELASAVPAPEEEMLADGVLPEGDATAAQDPGAPVAPDAAGDPQSAEVALPPAEDGTAVAEVAPAAPSGTEDSALAAPATAPGTSAADEIVLAAKDPVPDLPAPLDLPEASAQGDPLPLAQAPPPPFGTVYQFDANGLIVPTPEGIVTPEGVRLVAGKPPRVPPARPEGLAPPAAAPSAAEPAAESGALVPAADPALAGFRPKARPAGLAAPTELNEATPEPAPADAAPAVIDNRLAGKRPQARPETVLAAGEAVAAAQAAAAASLAAQAEAAAESEAAAKTAPGSPLAVAISRRPEARPRDLSRAVEAAVAAAIRTPEPKAEPEPEPEQTASLVPKKAPEKLPEPEPEAAQQPKTKSAAKSIVRGRDSNDEAEADEEPEVASAAPSGKTSGSVAKQATFKNALALDKTALIGVYGTPSKRYAMIRTSGGRYKKVKVGDSVDGGRIQAITASEVRYQKGSKLLTLSLPKG